MTTTATRAVSFSEIERAHSVFFSPSTMRFWGSRISWGSITPFEDGVMFITSEHNFDRSARFYTLRFANLETIDTVGEFNKFATLASAKRALRAHILSR